MNVDCLNRLVIHINIPNLQGKIIPWKNISTIMTKVDVRYRRDDFRKEGTMSWIFSLLKYYTINDKIRQEMQIFFPGLPLACWSHKADSLISLNLIVPLLELYIKTLHCWGWNSAAVMTSVNSSIFAGLISTMSIANIKQHAQHGAAKLTKTLIWNIQIPKVDSQVISRNIRLAIRVDWNGIDMISMRYTNKLE